MIEQQKCLVCGKCHPTGLPCPDAKVTAVSLDKVLIASIDKTMRRMIRGVK